MFNMNTKSVHMFSINCQYLNDTKEVFIVLV